MKRAVTIQDISCFGKCSITVALPIISAMGIECAVVPTAVLSTHTGGFKGYTFRDLTDDIKGIGEHWKKEELRFDGIYSGYLASPLQAEIVSDFVDDFSPAFYFVDPAMADNGKLYSGFDMSIVEAMRKLCKKADMIVPNITEASMLSGMEFRRSGEYDMEYIEKLLLALTDIGAKKATVTGVVIDQKHGAVSYDSEEKKYASYFVDNLPMSCHGTGDIFSSAMFSSLLRGNTENKSLQIAVDFTVDCMKHTFGDRNYWYGVKFEECIPNLISML